jgi:hypothetical protein
VTREDADEEPARRTGRVEPGLADRDDRAAETVQLGDARHASDVGAVESVEGDHDHGADGAPACVVYEAVEDWPALRRALLLLVERRLEPASAREGP